MSTPTFPDQASDQATEQGGYKSVHARYGNSEYTMTLYEGFVGSSSVRPNGVDAVQLYQQTGVYKVPGGKNPDPKSFVVLQGGPNNRNLRLDIDDTAESGHQKGPVKRITVTFRDVPSTTPPSNNEPGLVQIIGSDKDVESIFVEVYSHALEELSPQAAAGTTGSGSGDTGGETWVVDNDAKTCPPHC